MKHARTLGKMSTKSLGGPLIIFLIAGFTGASAAPQRGKSQQNLALLPDILGYAQLPGADPGNLGQSETGVGGSEEDGIAPDKVKILDRFIRGRDGGRVLRRVKRGEKEEEEEGWGAANSQLTGRLPPEGAAGGRSDSKEDSQEAINSGMAPVMGPYDKLQANVTSKDVLRVAPSVAPLMGQMGTKLSYTNWDEYVQYQRRTAKDAVSTRQAPGVPRKKAPERPLVMHSDDHFRDMDKLFKEKNDRVKAFHALVLFMKEQGKDFKIPRQPADKAPPKTGGELLNTAKL